MRIAFAIFRYFPFGGLQSDMLRIAREAVRRGHQVVVYTSQWQDELPWEDGLTVQLLPVHSLTNWGKAAEFEKTFHRTTCTEYFSLKVVFNRMGGGDFYFAADNCLQEELPKSHSRLALRLHPRYRTYLGQEARIFARGGQTRILYITERQKADYRQHYQTEEVRFLSLPPGMNSACRRPADAEAIRARKREELGLADNRFMLIQVGAVTQGKGCDRSLEAVAALPVEFRSRVEFFFAGGGHFQPFAKLARKAGVEKQVHFLGQRRDIPELLLAADLMVHPARNESAGSVLIESIAAGTPVVCSSECGFSPFVRESAGLITDLPFRQEQLNFVLYQALNNLQQATLSTRKYAETADFYSRAERAVDYFENKTGLAKN